MQQLPKLPPNLISTFNPNEQNELPAVYIQNPFPNNVNGLINGIDNLNLNYGNKALLDLEKSKTKEEITKGLQQGLNFGIPEIAQAQQTSPYKFANNTEVLPQDAEIPATRQVGQPLGAIEDFMPGGSKSQTPIISGGANKENTSLLRGIQDIYNGFRENADTPFSPQNLEQTKTADGRDRGIAYHLGEGLGTFGRGANSPGGRGLLTALAVGATGGNPTQAMTYGMQAGLGNYQNVQQDKMNRNLLQANGVDTSNIRGYLNNDMAKSYTDNYGKLNNAWYRTGKLTLDQVDQLRKAGVSEAQIRKLNADTDYTEGAKTDLAKAQTGYLGARTETEKGRPALIKAQIKALNDRTIIMAKRAANGDSSAKRELQSLNIQKQKLLIEQNQLINQTLRDGGGGSPDPSGSPRLIY